MTPWKARRSATARLVLQTAESAIFRPRPDAAKRLLDDSPTRVLSNKRTLRSCCVGSDRTSVSGFPTQLREVHGGGNHTILGPVFIDTLFPLLCMASSCETVVVPMAVSLWQATTRSHSSAGSAIRSTAHFRTIDLGVSFRFVLGAHHSIVSSHRFNNDGKVFRMKHRSS